MKKYYKKAVWHVALHLYNSLYKVIKDTTRLPYFLVHVYTKTRKFSKPSKDIYPHVHTSLRSHLLFKSSLLYFNIAEHRRQIAATKQLSSLPLATIQKKPRKPRASNIKQSTSEIHQICVDYILLLLLLLLQLQLLLEQLIYLV